MYIDKRGGYPVYENLDELLETPNNFITEYEDCYYVQPKFDNPWDEGTIWKVDKKTEKASYFGGYVDYITTGLTEKATPINIDKFLSERKRHSA